MSDRVPPTPPRVRKGGNAFTFWLGHAVLRVLGWRVTGELPDLPRFIAIASPHTSNWDWVLAMAAQFAMGIRINYLVKDTAFFWPLSVILRATGGMATNRLAPAGMVEDVAERLLRTPEIIIVITPEGTRSRVERWKTGFLRIAELADLPLLLVSWHYPDKVIHFGPMMKLSGDHEADIAAIRAYYRPFIGRNPQYQSP